MMDIESKQGGTEFRIDVEAKQVGTKQTSEDLSQEIQRTMKKEPGEFVRCTRVGANNYRCNWWGIEETGSYDNPMMGGLLVTTHRVRQSRFLSVTKSGEQLVIREATARSSLAR
jgi:hypothetical protein